MKNNHPDTELDELIRSSLKLTDQPSPELNHTLKTALYRQEDALRKSPATRSLTLWYLPMVLNLITFLLLAAAALTAISNIWLSYLAAGICFYIGLAGVLLTVIGTKRTTIKKDLSIHVRKRGVLV